MQILTVVVTQFAQFHPRLDEVKKNLDCKKELKMTLLASH
jgi:hypothetical protein